MMETNTSLDVLTDEEREKLRADTEKSASRAHRAPGRRGRRSGTDGQSK
ncbi:hypothetical protein [Streptomyces xantholiticus]|uniref:Uncharacterized protein n=1 Tax=Streptomyces xantholiticus TaxID=68285 RepID=A0ABV1URB8_9ACTN